MYFADRPFLYSDPAGNTYQVFVSDDGLRIVYRDAMTLDERIILEGTPDEVLPLLRMAAAGEMGRTASDIAMFREVVEYLAGHFAEIANDVSDIAEQGRRTGWQVRSDAIVAMSEELLAMAAECRARGDAMLSGRGGEMLSGLQEANALIEAITDRVLELNDAVIRLN